MSFPTAAILALRENDILPDGGSSSELWAVSCWVSWSTWCSPAGGGRKICSRRTSGSRKRSSTGSGPKKSCSSARNDSGPPSNRRPTACACRRSTGVCCRSAGPSVKYWAVPKGNCSTANWSELTHPEDLDVSQTAAVRLLSGQASCLEFEKRYIGRQGNVIWARVKISLLRDRAGKPAHFVTHIEDVTGRKAAEFALRQREERFRTAFEYAPFGLALAARDGRILQVNATVCRMLGYSEEELLALPWSAISHPDDVAVSQEAMARLERDRPEWVEYEKRYLHKEGRIVWARIRVSLVTKFRSLALRHPPRGHHGTEAGRGSDPGQRGPRTAVAGFDCRGDLRH